MDDGDCWSDFHESKENLQPTIYIYIVALVAMEVGRREVFCTTFLCVCERERERAWRIWCEKHLRLAKNGESFFCGQAHETSSHDTHKCSQYWRLVRSVCPPEALKILKSKSNPQETFVVQRETETHRERMCELGFWCFAAWFWFWFWFCYDPGLQWHA
jgi:hypothetical protein